MAFHFPVRPIRLPKTVDAMSSPPIMGMVSGPDWVGVAPRASCMYWHEKCRGAEHGNAHREACDDGERDGAVLEQVERNDRFLRLELDDHGGNEQNSCAEHHGEGGERGPLKRIAGQGDLQQDDGDDRHRKGYEKVPAPAESIRHHAAEERPADGAEGHDSAEQAGVLAALAGADDVGHDDLAEGGQAAGAEALQDAERDECGGVL